jgi:hypothetical protein
MRNPTGPKTYIGDLFPSGGAGAGPSMEELICNVEILRGRSELVARVSSEAGGVREYRGANADAVIDQVVNDLQEEFESAPAS